MIFNEVYSTLTSLRDDISSKSDAILAKYDLGFTENLDQIGTFLGIPRRSTEVSRLQNRFISITHNLGLATFNITIPSGTKFYLDDTIYVYTTADQYIDQDTLLDVMFSIDIDSFVPIIQVSDVVSQNTELLDYTFTTTRTIDPQSSTEDNETYAGRIVQKMSLKSFSNESKMDFVLKTLNITSYYINSQMSLPGTIEVVIAPPEMARFDEYKTLVINSMRTHLGDDATTRIIIKYPTIRRLEVTNYTSIDDDGTDYVNNLPLGSLVNLDILQSYFGENTNFILDGVALTSNTQLAQYEKLEMYIISIGGVTT